MCQWHMSSTDRSGAETWERVARSNPQASTREPSAKQTAECEARLFVPQAAQSSPYRRIQIRNLIRDSSDERNRLRNGD